MAITAAAYARQLKQLLPRGRLWALEADSKLTALLLGIATELARVDARGEDLVDELDPSTATETLEEWEDALGITPASGASDSERQVAIAAKYIARGGQTAAYFEALADALGFDATVTDGALANHWTMTVDTTTAPYPKVTTLFRVGVGRCGDPLGSTRIVELEDPINEAKPAHTRALFVYAP